jgi:ABC-type transporter Mla subunit MlaD
MKKNISDYIVATIVVLCSAALLTALTLALSKRGARNSDRLVFVDFPDVSGIRLYSEVRYGGALAGEVRGIRHLTAEERAESGNVANTVRVSVALDDALPPLPSDVTVGLGSDTLLSEKFVAFSGGDPEGPALEAEAVLQGAAGLNLDRLATTAEALIASAQTLIGNLEPVLENTDLLITGVREKIDVTLPKLDEFIDSANEVTGSADDLLGHAERFLGDNEEAVAENLEKLKGAIGNLNALLGKTSGFVGATDAEVSVRMAELQVVLENLKVVTTHAKAITETLGERPSRLVWPSKRRKLPSEEEILRSDQPVRVQPLD